MPFEHSAPDFKDKMNSARHFPMDQLLSWNDNKQGDAAEVERKSNLLIDAVVRKEDLEEEYSGFSIRDGFRIVFGSHFSVDDYQDFLKDSLDLTKCKVINIHIDG